MQANVMGWPLLRVKREGAFFPKEAGGVGLVWEGCLIDALKHCVCKILKVTFTH